MSTTKRPAILAQSAFPLIGKPWPEWGGAQTDMEYHGLALKSGRDWIYHVGVFRSEEPGLPRSEMAMVDEARLRRLSEAMAAGPEGKEKEGTNFKGLVLRPLELPLIGDHEATRAPDYGGAFNVPPEHWSGTSHELAVGIALWGAALGVPVPSWAIFTGTFSVVPPGPSLELWPITELVEKAELVFGAQARSPGGSHRRVIDAMMHKSDVRYHLGRPEDRSRPGAVELLVAPSRSFDDPRLQDEFQGRFKLLPVKADEAVALLSTAPRGWEGRSYLAGAATIWDAAAVVGLAGPERLKRSLQNGNVRLYRLAPVPPSTAVSVLSTDLRKPKALVEQFLERVVHWARDRWPGPGDEPTVALYGARALDDSHFELLGKAGEDLDVAPAVLKRAPSSCLADGTEDREGRAIVRATCWAPFDFDGTEGPEGFLGLWRHVGAPFVPEDVKELKRAFGNRVLVILGNWRRRARMSEWISEVQKGLNRAAADAAYRSVRGLQGQGPFDFANQVAIMARREFRAFRACLRLLEGSKEGPVLRPLGGPEETRFSEEFLGGRVRVAEAGWAAARAVRNTSDEYLGNTKDDPHQERHKAVGPDPAEAVAHLLLRHEERALGVLSLDWAAVKWFVPQLKQRLRLFADEVALHLRSLTVRARAHAILGELRREIERSSSPWPTDDLFPKDALDVIERALPDLLAVTGAKCVVLYLRDWEDGQYRVALERGHEAYPKLQEELRKWRFQRGVPALVSYIVEHKVELVIRDHNDPRELKAVAVPGGPAPRWSKFKIDESQSYMGFPIHQSDGVFGVLRLMKPTTPEGFSVEDVANARLIADALSDFYYQAQTRPRRTHASERMTIAAIRSPNARALAFEAFEVVKEGLGECASGIRLLDVTTGPLGEIAPTSRRLAASNAYWNVNDSVPLYRPIKSGLTGYVLATRGEVVLDENGVFPRDFDDHEAPDRTARLRELLAIWKSIACFPLFDRPQEEAGAEVIGTLSVARTARFTISPSDMVFLRRVARALGPGLALAQRNEKRAFAEGALKWALLLRAGTIDWSRLIVALLEEIGKAIVEPGSRVWAWQRLSSNGAFRFLDGAERSPQWCLSDMEVSQLYCRTGPAAITCPELAGPDDLWPLVLNKVHPVSPQRSPRMALWLRDLTRQRPHALFLAALPEGTTLSVNQAQWLQSALDQFAPLLVPG